MSASYQTSGMRDAAVRRAFDRMQSDYDARNLRGLFAARPATAPYGAWFRCEDAEAPPAGHGGEVYWYAGEGFGWVLVHTEVTGAPPTVLHNSLSDLQGGAADQYYHLPAAVYDALIDPAAQLAALHTDGTPQFARLGLGGPAHAVRLLTLSGAFTTDPGRQLLALQNTSAASSARCDISLANNVGNGLLLGTASSAYNEIANWANRAYVFSGTGLNFVLPTGNTFLWQLGAIGASLPTVMSLDANGLHLSSGQVLTSNGHGLKLTDDGTTLTVSRV